MTGETLLLPERAGNLHKIIEVSLWSNGNVMVFGEDGQQMPEYQGRYENVREKINAVSSGIWYSGSWNAGRIGVLSYGEEGPPVR